MRYATRGWRLIGILAGLALPGCTPARPLPRAADPAPLPWTPFHWVSVTAGGTTFSQAAILVPFTADTLGPGTYWLQLDTGADVGIWIYRNPLEQLLRRRGAVRDTTTYFSVARGRVGAHELRDEALNMQRYAGDTVRADDPRPKIGTLGIRFFLDKLLLLDFPGQRFAILDSAGLPDALAARASWVPVEFRNDRMFIPVTLNGRTETGYFYDSGASVFPLVTTHETWQRATGRTGEEPDNLRWTVPSFGQQVVLVGAPAHGTASVGAARLERPMIMYIAQGPESLDFRTWGYPVSGLVGNVLFADRYMVIIDLPRRRMGLLDRAAR
jgi:hypothetical protein